MIQPGDGALFKRFALNSLSGTARMGMARAIGVYARAMALRTLVTFMVVAIGNIRLCVC